MPAHQRLQLFCSRCNERRVDFPMVVVTCFIARGEKLLWMRRGLEPKAGCWAIPGGFLENDETLAEGAARELREETGIELPASALELYMVGSITFINQVYVAFRASVDSDFVAPGNEALECRFFSLQDCPWDEVAYPEVNDVIEQAYRDLATGEFRVWHSQMTAKGYQRWAVAPE
ncbi:NUDIX domain-containing protein [Parahaliea sp. F7430]|uniref:NUDIX domain-containing protein n=1 Tax=Sediminihaliea albiluteola TaxID=2758564 RepID=A0A7W2TTF9_9GAMM|nr:NUDIX domain-containing protein [Sediminihaliea albiluteola]MBA6411645.1 NUDIX domain-containing protein [Sediminihaliea albiluteola]